MTKISELNGIGRRMPWTMGAFAIGANRTCYRYRAISSIQASLKRETDIRSTRVASRCPNPNNPRRDGLIGLDQTSISLPLQKGRNELLLVIVDSFGGWGLMGQIEGRKGIEWEAK